MPKYKRQVQVKILLSLFKVQGYYRLPWTQHKISQGSIHTVVITFLSPEIQVEFKIKVCEPGKH